MSTEVWKRDKKPYLVFKCKKCHQYSYVKINQKTKKCLRCGRTHQVRLIIPTGEIVYGITAALELVKEKQSKFIKNPDFRVDQSFNLYVPPEKKQFVSQNLNHKGSQKSLEAHEIEDKNFSSKFKEMLTELNKLHPFFPKYLIDIMAENYSIPKKLIPSLIKNLTEQGILRYSKEKDHYVLVKSRNAS